MAMAVDSRHQQQPQFTNPWVSAPASTHGQMYATSLPATSMAGGDPHRYAPVSSAAYSSAPLASDGLNRSYAGSAYAASAAPPVSSYASSAAPVSSYASSAAPSYGYAYHSDRRPSHPLNTASEAERQQFSDALDASRGMVAMSQSDITPRPMYGSNAAASHAHAGSSRSSTDSYGFPSQQSHSSHSSISSASTYPSYYNSSVSDGSVTGDYSSASESVDMPQSRTLPRPQGLIPGSMPPAPQSMMGQFSSKVASSSQKKHKCKICDKRFTRPSSLQTHMYSHTGEKPFACDVEGCGRHFSVVSNLRRHRKVHKGEGRDHPSPDEDDE